MVTRKERCHRRKQKEIRSRNAAVVHDANACSSTSNKMPLMQNREAPRMVSSRPRSSRRTRPRVTAPVEPVMVAATKILSSRRCARRCEHTTSILSSRELVANAAVPSLSPPAATATHLAGGEVMSFEMRTFTVVNVTTAGSWGDMPE